MVSKFSIAVLPFVNMSSDKENEYFSDGISEEILNALSRIQGLHVTARTSSFAFKNKNIDIREIGRTLNVAMILEGSIRKSNQIVRITAQLTKAEDGFHLWSETWDRELKDIFIVQDEIAALIAEKVNKDIEPNIDSSDHVVENTESLDLYLKARYLQNKWDPSVQETIINLYEKAIELEPKMVNAYVGLCDLYTWLGSIGAVDPRVSFGKVQYYVSRVMEFDPDVPEIYRIIANKNYWFEWDLRRAIQNIDKALKIKPSYPDALIQKGLILASLGKIEESLDCMFQAERLNPLSDSANYTIGMVYHTIGEHERALEFVNKNIEVNPLWDAQYYTKVEALCALNRYEEAWDTINDFYTKTKNSQLVEFLKAFCFASRKEREPLNKIIKPLRAHFSKEGEVNSIVAHSFCQIYLLLGEIDEALHYMEIAMRQNAAPFLMINIESQWDPYRNHPRFKEIINKVPFMEMEHDSSPEPKKYKKTSISKELAAETGQRLQEIMESGKLYLNPTLTLYDLAERVELTTNQLSQILNEFIGKNFYDYVNSFRLNHFLDLFKKEQYKHYTLLGLAYECGFNSKSTFNSFFRKTLGTTPSEYFKNL